MAEKKSIVVIGGGTGTHTVLRGLKRYQKQVDLTAIVTMADSGGSTGRLRDEFGYLPVGDVRMALTALASDDDEHDTLIRQLFLHRFDKGESVKGHNVGNLLLVALTDILGSEEAAIRAAARVLRVQGLVIPVTTKQVNLKATYDDGRVVIGEHDIDEPTTGNEQANIISLEVTPKADINPKAEEAILNADLIVLGPGDLYTSVLANCVVDGVASALTHTTAQLVYVSNLMTKAGQTNGMGAGSHLKEISRYIGRAPDVVLINNGEIPRNLQERYLQDGEVPVLIDCSADTCRLVVSDFLATEEIETSSGDKLKRSLVRHDSRKLARAIIDELQGNQPLFKE